MRKSCSFGEITDAIKALAARDNLAAVLIQLNDTYLIDERPDSGIPGMARIAGLAKFVRSLVRESTGEDRTLLLHSGDYLSPAFMSKRFKGRQMVELMNLCGVDFATLGNHEFDFGDLELRARLAEAMHVNVLANMEAPPGYLMRELVFWPEKEPFLAITGLVGDQTAGKAEAAGFRRLPLDETVEDILAQVRADARIGGLVVLSHMDRKEDKELQELLSERWHRTGFIYLLGGHDHDIYWRERDRENCYLSKCESNCKSITLFLVPKDGIAAPDRGTISTLRVYPSEEEEKLLAHSESRFLAKRAVKGPPPTFERVRNAWRRIAPAGLRADFGQAFETQMAEVYQSMHESEIAREAAYGSLDLYVVSQAAAQTIEGFRGGALEISERAHVLGLPVDPESTRAVEAWAARLEPGADDAKPVADFSAIARGPMDATEKSLRRRSTDFGNFAADAVKLATGADLVMLNSGAFRFDGPISPRPTRKDLREVFMFDQPDAVMLVRMDAGEVREFYEYARGRGGHGAFLQVSNPAHVVETLAGPLRVALIRHMLKDREDGFRDLLASRRGIAPERLLAEIESYELADGSLIELIAEGAARGARYSDEPRLSSVDTSEPLLQAEEELLELIDRYRQASERLGISGSDSLDLLGNPGRTDIPVDLEGIAKELYRSVLGAMQKNYELKFYDNRDTFYLNFYRQLAHSPAILESGIRYQDYFERAYGFILEHHRRLHPQNPA